MKTLGLDVGSTTLKAVVLDGDKILYSAYVRHLSRVGEKFKELSDEMADVLGDEFFNVTISGSAGMGLSEKANIPFVQEVFAEQLAVKKLNPYTDTVIELGGEDAKILFLTGGFEMRMNGTCAGGTGAFIDQMAALIKVTPEELNSLAEKAERVYQIASRCGVFAKSDVQPLINQGAKREDIAAGIYSAVVSQTIAGLAQGREIKGNIVYLGGPLTFSSYLRKAMDECLKTRGVLPENSLYYVAIGAAFANVGKKFNLSELVTALTKIQKEINYNSVSPLFSSRQEYDEFTARHKKKQGAVKFLNSPNSEMYLGVDAGSTTVKILLTNKNGDVFNPFYSSNDGNPVPIVKKYLQDFYNKYPDVKIIASAVTGYGEEVIKNAFNLDFGLVETMAHYTAAKRFNENVDFILDIGGQDIKCFKIRNGAIDGLYLNEACSSGCGSFLQTFAEILGFTAQEFSRLALFADHPVDLGSRCTVFMNSSIKQAQKDGASVENIAAGLSISVVKNALYKVIRCADGKNLGKNIVVQGGTFKSDAVLKAFERETGVNVIRPETAELMGAYGCALYAISKNLNKSKTITNDELKDFVHQVKSTTCKGCTNRCNLTINTFLGGRKFIAGNRCQKGAGKSVKNNAPDLFSDKLSLLSEYMKNEIAPEKKTVGFMMGLNFYELLPFWHAFFKTLDFNVLTSPTGSRELYLLGQNTIPSDTACYPAKLMHGHAEWLLKHRPDYIFYPNMSYNTEENMGVNHFNCPVVAYYPQVLKLNVSGLNDENYICDFLSISDKKQFTKRIHSILSSRNLKFTKKQISAAVKNAYLEYETYLNKLRDNADKYIAEAISENKPIRVVVGRPYHADPEINHGIHSLISESGATVITEEGLRGKISPFSVNVRNQWTYHARLYASAKFVKELEYKNIALIQLVSFGCGVDAITTDEVRSIVESGNKVYTQIKIDEVSNMGAVNIRLRSLSAVLEEKIK